MNKLLCRLRRFSIREKKKEIEKLKREVLSLKIENACKVRELAKLERDNEQFEELKKGVDLTIKRNQAVLDQINQKSMNNGKL